MSRNTLGRWWYKPGKQLTVITIRGRLGRACISILHSTIITRQGTRNKSQASSEAHSSVLIWCTGTVTVFDFDFERLFDVVKESPAEKTSKVSPAITVMMAWRVLLGVIEHWCWSPKYSKHLPKFNKVLLSGWPIYVLCSSFCFIDIQLPQDGAAVILPVDFSRSGRTLVPPYTVKSLFGAQEPCSDGCLVFRYCSVWKCSDLMRRKIHQNCRCNNIWGVSGDQGHFVGYPGAYGWWHCWCCVSVNGCLGGNWTDFKKLMPR